MLKRNRVANEWAWRRLHTHLMASPVQYQPLTIPTLGFRAQPDDRWKTVKPVVSINKVYDNIIDGWYASVSGMNVRVEGYVSQ